MIAFKINDEQQAALGVATVEDIIARLQRLQAAEAELVQAKQEAAAMNEQLANLNARLDALEASVSLIASDSVEAIRKDILADAVAESTKAAMGIITKIGAAALPASAPLDDNSSAPAVAADDYEGQWKSNPALQDEFSSLATYAAYARAEAAGQVRLLKQPTN